MRRWSTQRKTNDSKSLPKLEKGLVRAMLFAAPDKKEFPMFRNRAASQACIWPNSTLSRVNMTRSFNQATSWFLRNTTGVTSSQILRLFLEATVANKVCARPSWLMPKQSLNVLGRKKRLHSGSVEMHGGDGAIMPNLTTIIIVTKSTSKLFWRQIMFCAHSNSTARTPIVLLLGKIWIDPRSKGGCESCGWCQGCQYQPLRCIDVWIDSELKRALKPVHPFQRRYS